MAHARESAFREIPCCLPCGTQMRFIRARRLESNCWREQGDEEQHAQAARLILFPNRALHSNS